MLAWLKTEKFQEFVRIWVPVADEREYLEDDDAFPMNSLPSS